MSEANTFIDLVINGSRLASEIDDYVAAWHEGEDSRELHEFLGLTLDEYDLWVASPNFLELIIFSRVSGTSLVEVANDNFIAEQRIAARTDKVWMMDRLEEWISEHNI